MTASLNGKSKWAVQPGQLIRPEPFGLAFPETYPGYTFSVLHLIVEGDGVSLQVDSPG
jgi:hypothetical protein